MRHKHWLLTGVLLALACSQPEKKMPASFLDEAPPPPTSSTVVLSGGTLVLEQVTADSAIVLRNGKLIAWGKRGEVEMPNDSVGKDLRGKWITPGTIDDLETGNLPNLAELKIAAPANLLVLKVGPGFDGVSSADLYGVVVQGELQILEESSD